MGKGLEQTLLQGRHTEGPETHERMLAIRKVWIKTKRWYHSTPVRVTIINKSKNKCWWGCGEKETRVHCWWECRLVQPLWKTLWNFLRKLKMELPFDPVIPLLRWYPKNAEARTQRKLCTPMFIAPQFPIAKCWEQPKCLSGNEWIKNYGTITQWDTTQQRERRSSYPL